MNERLARAKQYLAIADSKDAKHEAYKKAARELAAYKEETGCSYAELGRLIGRKASHITALVKWHDSGCKAETPFLADTEATTRAERSHARKMLSTPAEAEKLLSDTKVLAAISSSPQAAAALMRAAGEVGDRMHTQERARHREQSPDLSRSAELLSIITTLSNARSGVIRSYDRLQDLVLTEDERGQVTAFADRLNTAADLLVSFLSGEGVDFNELLREEV